jgi:hypothetical protein
MRALRAQVRFKYETFVNNAYVLNEMCNKIKQDPLPNKEQLQSELQSRGLKIYEEVIPAVENLVFVCRSTGGEPSQRLLDYAVGNLDQETNRVLQIVAGAGAGPGLAQLELRHIEAWHDLLEATIAREALRHVPSQELDEGRMKQLDEYLEGVEDLPALADVLRRVAMRRMVEMKASQAVGEQPLVYYLEPGLVRPSASVVEAMKSFPDSILIKHVVPAFNVVNERFELQQLKIRPQAQPAQGGARRPQPTRRKPPRY